MSHDHHHPESIQDAMARQIASEVSRIAPYMIQKAVGGALSAASGTLRERSYAFSPIDATKLFADPHPINTIGTELPMGMGALLHDRLLHMVNSYLLIVHYDGTEQHTTFKLCATYVQEEALSTSPPVDFLHGVLRDEIVRQVATLPPQAPGTFRLLGLSLIGDYFKRPALESFWAPAGGIPAEVAAAAGNMTPEQDPNHITDVVPVQVMPETENVEALAAAYAQAAKEVKPTIPSVRPGMTLPKAQFKHGLPEAKKMSDPLVQQPTAPSEIAQRLALAKHAASGSSMPSVALAPIATATPTAPVAAESAAAKALPVAGTTRTGISLPKAALKPTMVPEQRNW